MKLPDKPILPIIMLTAGFFVGLSGQVQAFVDKPVAIVEAIKAQGTSIKLLDFLFTGDAIKLGDGETVTLSYLSSCIVEEFKGGVVTVGVTQSVVLRGRLEYRQEVDCGGGGIVPTEHQGQDLAGVVFPVPGSDKDDPLIMIYATKPVFAFAEPVTELVIARIDPGFTEERRLLVASDRLDLADEKLGLVPGGLYRATTEKGSVLFSVSDSATATGSSVIGRLIGLGW